MSLHIVLFVDCEWPYNIACLVSFLWYSDVGLLTENRKFIPYPSLFYVQIKGERWIFMTFFGLSSYVLTHAQLRRTILPRCDIIYGRPM